MFDAKECSVHSGFPKMSLQLSRLAALLSLFAVLSALSGVAEARAPSDSTIFILVHNIATFQVASERCGAGEREFNDNFIKPIVKLFRESGLDVADLERRLKVNVDGQRMMQPSACDLEFVKTFGNAYLRDVKDLVQVLSE